MWLVLSTLKPSFTRYWTCLAYDFNPSFSLYEYDICIHIAVCIMYIPGSVSLGVLDCCMNSSRYRYLYWILTVDKILGYPYSYP